MTGRLPQGPRTIDGSPLPLEPGEITFVTARAMEVHIPSDALGGLLGPFNGRARVILLRLLAGFSMGMAAAAAGLSKHGLDSWRERDPEFAQAVTLAYDIGFGAVIEAGAYSRAMDRNDRASGRLLELILKARGEEYREKSQVQLSVIRAVGSAFDGLAGDWEQPAALPDSGVSTKHEVNWLDPTRAERERGVGGTTPARAGPHVHRRVPPLLESVRGSLTGNRE